MATMTDLSNLVLEFNKSQNNIFARKKIPSDFRPEVVEQKIKEDLKTNQDNFLKKSDDFLKSVQLQFENDWQQILKLKYPNRYAGNNLTVGESLTTDQLLSKKSFGSLESIRAFNFYNLASDNYSLVINEIDKSLLTGDVDYFNSLVDFILAEVPGPADQVNLSAAEASFYKAVERYSNEFESKVKINEIKSRMNDTSNVLAESQAFNKALSAGAPLYYSKVLTKAMNNDQMMNEFSNGMKAIDVVNQSTQYWKEPVKIETRNKIVV